MINHFRTVLCNLEGPAFPGNPYEFLRESYAPTDLGMLEGAWRALFGTDPDRMGVLLQAHRIVQTVQDSPELRAAITFFDRRVAHPSPPAGSVEAESATAGVTLSTTGVTVPDLSGRMSRTFEVVPSAGGHIVTETRTGRSVKGAGSLVLPVTSEVVSVSGEGRFTLRRYTGPSLGDAGAAMSATPLSYLFDGEDPSLLRIWENHPVSRVRLGAAACAMVSKLTRIRGL